MKNLSKEQEELKHRVQKVLGRSIQFCLKVLSQVEIHAFKFMSDADPNVFEISHIFDFVILPILEKLESDPNLLPEDAIKIVNIQQYSLHLRNIVKALNKNDEPAFNQAVKELDSESFLL